MTELRKIKFLQALSQPDLLTAKPFRGLKFWAEIMERI